MEFSSSTAAIDMSSIAGSSFISGGLDKKSETGFDLAGRYLMSVVH